MSDLIALSCSREQQTPAGRLFAEASASMERIKGIRLSDQWAGGGFFLARFASPRSRTPRIVGSTELGHVFGLAGWAQATRHPGAPEPLESLASKMAARPPLAEVLTHLEGQYAGVWIDQNAGSLTAWVDRLGMMPGYFAAGNGMAWFSTSAIVLASVLRPRLDVHSVKTLFLGRCPNSPRSLFDGIQRLRFGQHLEMSEGTYRIESTWTPFRPAVPYRGIDEALEEGTRLFRQVAGAIRSAYPCSVQDFTSGLDTRLVVASMYRGRGDKLSVTVSGPPENVDVAIAKLAAERFGWHIFVFGTPQNWPSERWDCFRDGVALSEGELSGNRIDRVIPVKKGIRDTGGVAVSGGGGELYREFFWQQEFLRIGRTSALDLRRLIRYRFDFSGDFDSPLFEKGWYPDYLASEVATLQAIIDMAPGALNTAKLDAIYVWKSAAHVGRYAAATNPIVLTLAPLMTQTLAEYTLAMPWRFRMNGRLVRGLISRLSPELAKVPTWYGSSAEPLSVRRPVQLAKYGVNAAQKLARKLGQVTLRRSIFKNPILQKADHSADCALTEQLRREGMLDAKNLISAPLYDAAGLAKFLQDAQKPDFARFAHLQVLASIELVCRIAGLGRPC